MRIVMKNEDQVELLSRSRFDGIRKKEFRPAFDLMGLKYLREKAKNELGLRELYRARAPYELLQNADDAGAKQAIFILSHRGCTGAGARKSKIIIIGSRFFEESIE